MSPFGLSSLLAFISSLSFGLLVLLKSPSKKLGRIWFLFSLTVVIWGLGVFLTTFQKDQSKALLVWRSTFALSVIWMPVAFYHFVCNFCGLERRSSIVAHYLIGLTCFSIAWSPAFYSTVEWMFNSFFYPLPGKYMPLFMMWWFGSVIHSHWELVRAYRKSAPSKKNQIKYFFLAAVIGYGGGSLDYVPMFKINLYPWGNFTIFVYPLIMSFAILKYRLLNIKIVLRRASLIALIYIGLILLLTPIAWPLYPILLTSKWGFPLGILVGSVVLSVGPFIYAYLVKRSTFFQERVVSGVTHEFKSPLASIKSAAGILKDELERISHGKPLKTSQGRMTDYLLMIENNIQRLECFINNLLQLAKIEQETDLKMVDANLNELCRSAIEPYKSIADQKNVRLEFVPNGAGWIRCDPEKIQLVISNLVSNAVKFTPQGQVEVRIESEGREAKISVKDAGSGIPSEDLPHIFEKFYQGRNAANIKGSGLGLSIVKGWVEAHGGRVWVESGGTRQGTEVTFTLPG